MDNPSFTSILPFNELTLQSYRLRLPFLPPTGTYGSWRVPLSIGSWYEIQPASPRHEIIRRIFIRGPKLTRSTGVVQAETCTVPSTASH